jgi:hypothetical protein
MKTTALLKVLSLSLVLGLAACANTGAKSHSHGHSHAAEAAPKVEAPAAEKPKALTPKAGEQAAQPAATAPAEAPKVKCPMQEGMAGGQHQQDAASMPKDCCAGTPKGEKCPHAMMGEEAKAAKKKAPSKK